MLIKITRRYDYAPTTVARSKKTEHTDVGKAVKQSEVSYAAGGKVKGYW